MVEAIYFSVSLSMGDHILLCFSISFQVSSEELLEKRLVNRESMVCL